MNSINRTLDILSFVTTCASPITPQTISKELDIPISTVYRLLTILINWEFVTYSKQYGTYTVGAQSIKTQEKYYHHSLLMTSSKSELHALAKRPKKPRQLLPLIYGKPFVSIKLIVSKPYAALSLWGTVIQ